MATSSANFQGEPPAHTFDELNPELLAKVPASLGDGSPRSGISSTVVDCTGDAPRVIRVGAIHLTTSPDLRNFAMEALDRKGRCCSVCIRAVRGSMTRSMNDVVAMEAASLFMEEFARRSVASPHMLLHGVWPKHPFDDAVERLASFFEARFSPGGSLWRIGRELEPAACSIASSCDCASCGCIGRIVQGALYDASAEAIGATSRAWVNDAGEKAADFSAVEQAFS